MSISKFSRLDFYSVMRYEREPYSLQKPFLLFLMKSSRSPRIASRNSDRTSEKSPVPSTISNTSSNTRNRTKTPKSRQTETPKTIDDAPNLTQSPITPQNRNSKQNNQSSSKYSDKSTQSPPKIYFHTSVECLTSKSRICSPSKMKNSESKSLYSPSPTSARKSKRSTTLVQSEDSELVSLEEAVKPQIVKSSRSSVVKSRRNTEASYVVSNNLSESMQNEQSHISQISNYTTESEQPVITLKKTYAVVRKSDIGSKDLLEVPDGFFITEHDLRKERARNNYSETESRYSLSSQLRPSSVAHSSSTVVDISSMMQMDSQNSLMVNPGASLHERTQSDVESRNSIKLLNSSAVETYNTDLMKVGDSYSQVNSGAEVIDFVTGESDLAPGQISSILPHYSPPRSNYDESEELTPEDMGIWLVYPGKSKINF